LKHERHRIFTSFLSNRHLKSFVLKNTFIQVPAKALLLLAKVALPFLPLIFGFIFLKPKYILNYRETIQKLRIHHKALSQGPVQRYFESFFAVRLNESSQISGACTQCGSCCLNQQCFFLEPISEDKFQCGIYTSPFRKLSNCGAFPISGEDIERYECPGYVLNPRTVIKIAVVN
jgi:hypothetical protein